MRLLVVGGLLLSSLGLAASASAAQIERPDRTYEGDWYVSDQTNNNTGEREVYAFILYIKSSDPDYVTVTMRCADRQPTLFVEWDRLAFPDQAVLTIGATPVPSSSPSGERYIFEKSQDTANRGLRASPEQSAQIVTALGEAKFATVTAHLASGARTVGLEVTGTLGAWSRVSRHCPVETVPQPPL